jgi:signal peptidase I
VFSHRPVSHSATREYLESLVVTVILALYGTTFLLQAFKIPSSSMEDTLLVGDHLMVDKVAYAPGWSWGRLLPYQQIERDHIIIFRHPEDPATYLVKRVIGAPGDHIQLRDKQVFRNGERLPDPWAIHQDARFNEFRDNFPNFTSGAEYQYADWAAELPQHVRDGEVTVPAGHYFVMGDNRDWSADSRYWGFVPRDNIIGKPLLLYWSFETSSEEYRRTSAVDYARRLREILFYFPQRTRWDRMLRVMR